MSGELTMRSGQVLDGSGSNSTSEHEPAYRPDSEFENSELQRHVDVISTVSLGVQLRSLSFHTLTEIAGTLLHTTNEVIDVILNCNDIRKNNDLFCLMKDYFDGSIQTLNSSNALDKCLKNFSASLLIFEAEGNTQSASMEVEKRKQFKAVVNSFNWEFSKTVEAVYRLMKLTFEKLVWRKENLDNKLKILKFWKKISKVFFAAMLTAVFVCAIVNAVLAATPVAAATAAISAVPIASLERWIDSLLKKYMEALQLDTDIISLMQFHCTIVLKDLEALLVDKLEFVMEDVQRRLPELVTDMGNKIKRCNNNILKARTTVLKKLIEYP